MVPDSITVCPTFHLFFSNNCLPTTQAFCSLMNAASLASTPGGSARFAWGGSAATISMSLA